MERLTTRTQGNVIKCLECEECDYCYSEIGCDAIDEALEKLKHYEDLEEQGLLMKLPCKVGDDVYKIPSKANYSLNVLHRHEENNRVYHQKVERICLDDGHWWFECDKDREYGTGRICVDVLFGETWFLDEAEAEKALAEMEK